ncbi:uncharacterized protein LOC141672600 [Apium graveolens]|uniref:uncharacterized protein LOC141672600 n=1 Tax=Apium graveolens TaxID=4045 RepID=UPI003D7AB52F
MEGSQVSAAPLGSKSLATKGTHVSAVPICQVDRRNVQQKKPNYEGNRYSPKFRPRAVLSSPENDHLIGGQGMIYFRRKTEMSQKKIGCPWTPNSGKEAVVKKSVLKHNKTHGPAMKKNQAPVA